MNHERNILEEEISNVKITRSPKNSSEVDKIINNQLKIQKTNSIVQAPKLIRNQFSSYLN